MDYRHEWKHEIGYADLTVLRSRLSAVMTPDSHGVDGRYRITSLYFDNLRDKALREKIDGVNHREKFRLRYYDDDLSFILLEKKSKHNGLCLKEKVPISAVVADLLARGEQLRLNGDEDLRQLLAFGRENLLRELDYKMCWQGLQPRAIVEYTREAFVYDPGNVRVTLDYNICTGMNCNEFLRADKITIPAGDALAVLEVKWDEFLPDLIRELVQLPGKRTAAFSKYAACRIYG